MPSSLPMRISAIGKHVNSCMAPCIQILRGVNERMHGQQENLLKDDPIYQIQFLFAA